MNECQSYKNKFWCATAVGKDNSFTAWGYCKKEECKEEKEELPMLGCLSCIVQFAAVCLPKCRPSPFNKACAICVLQNAPECAIICGLQDGFVDSEFGLEGVRDFQMEGEPDSTGPPPCVRVSQFYKGRLIPGSVVSVNSAAACGDHCNNNFGTQTVAWDWFTGNLKNGRNALKCFCLDLKSAQTFRHAFVNCGLGPAQSQPQCPPNAQGSAAAAVAAAVAAAANGRGLA